MYTPVFLQQLTGRLARGIAASSIDPRALYSVLVPRGDYVPGRILETHRLWERRWNDPLPYVSQATRPIKSDARTVGFLTIADYSVGAGAPEHLQLLREAPSIVLSDDPAEARRALAAYVEETSRQGESKNLGGWVFQARSFVRLVTVADPYRVRPLA
ncbi:hypothetical protein AB0D37_40155 [Streptomyces sp. NPDC048384]|uniref:hypothetical protein n=1 Tax=Streptomyces sp. NPDC048384 TaxID=3155487 RepID=UPI00341C0D9C